MYNNKLHFHFTGIGGSGMSGLAEVLITLGFKLSGSDLQHNEPCKRLQRLGATIFDGHRAENLPENASLLVYSSAVSISNPELEEARRRGIPVIRRAEVLAELMRLKYGVGVAGSHGKTTTTSMIAHILEVGGLDPTVIIGGQLKSMEGSGARLGKSTYLVAETDESDKSFLLLKPTVAVVTNIDAEHLEAYASMAELEESFGKFVEAVPFYGLAVFCIDDPRVRALAVRYSKRKVSYGLSPDAQFRAHSVEFHRKSTTFEVFEREVFIARVELPLLGVHMVSNALAAFAVGLEFGVSRESIVAALGSFGGVKRRIEVLGEARGVTVINDYAHHPTEIRATLRAVRAALGSSTGTLHVIFQPHRFSRTRSCFVEFLNAFGDCDNLILSEIYSAGEAPIDGVNGRALFEAVVHPSKRFAESFDGLLFSFVPELTSGDTVICMGAGTIGSFAERVLKSLAGA